MQRQEVYYLALSSDVLEAVLKRLRMFVMRSKVSLEDARKPSAFWAMLIHKESSA